MKGVFEKRPCFPRYKTTWDIKIVFDYLRTIDYSQDDLNLKGISMKTLGLIALLSAQRVQTLSVLKLSCMNLTDSVCKFTIVDILKQSKPGSHLSAIELAAYPHDTQLCVVNCINKYIQLTKDLRGDIDNLFITLQKPYKPASRDTLRRWLITLLNDAGVNVKEFKCHSTRSASTSAAAASNVPIDIIIQAAGWRGERTFADYYNKPIDEANCYSSSLLNSLYEQ